MKFNVVLLRRTTSAFAVSLTVLLAGGATAQVNVKGDTGIDASGNARQERAWCMVNTEGTARADCLKGSAAAGVEKRRGTLETNGRDYAANAPENRAYLDYYRDMGLSPIEARAFYAMTNSVPNASARWLNAAQMAQWVRFN